MTKPTSTDLHEGPDANERFKTMLGRIVQVPKDELARREQSYQRTRAEKPAATKKKSSHR
jgi:hypothetical protein